MFATHYSVSLPNGIESQRVTWERNGIDWGRPVPAMDCTDLRSILDGLAAMQWSNMDLSHVSIITRGSPGLAIAALFATTLDPRIGSVDLDFAQGCFEKRNLPVVANVLRYGDVLQWAALAADRKLTLRNVPTEAGDTHWLTEAFVAVQNPNGLHIAP